MPNLEIYLFYVKVEITMIAYQISPYTSPTLTRLSLEVEIMVGLMCGPDKTDSRTEVRIKQSGPTPDPTSKIC